MNQTSPQQIRTSTWQLTHTGGKMQALSIRFGEDWLQVPLQTGDYAGASIFVNGREIPFSPSFSDQGTVYRGSDGKDLGICFSYRVNSENQLVLSVRIENRSSRKAEFSNIKVRLGLDTFLLKYPEYLDTFFPTLLRCEKTHLWGYFSTPSGHLLGIHTDAPVASYTLDYEKDAQGIFTASLDLLQNGKLPDRHPRDLYFFEGNEVKEWNIFFTPIAAPFALEALKPRLARLSPLVLLHADAYTVGAKETSHLTVYSASPLTDDCLQVKHPDGASSRLPLQKVSGEEYRAVFEQEQPGVYTLTAENRAGYRAEMCLSVRRPWSWYLEKAAQAAVAAPQKATSHAESWYGFYSAYLARKYFPDRARDSAIDRKMAEVYPLMYESVTGEPLEQKDRIQNHSSMLGVCVDIYESTGSREALHKAEDFADLVLSFQKADGGVYKGETDYTSVIYPIKSVMELMEVEKELSASGDLSPEEAAYFASRYGLHLDAVGRAMKHLAVLDGNFSTEGATTSCYEDGANSCSATQMSQFALLWPAGSPERAYFTKAARLTLDRHSSHEQALIPVSLIAGGTLRYCEAQYDVEM